MDMKVYESIFANCLKGDSEQIAASITKAITSVKNKVTKT